ncbi:MAG TPA: hypothetical protein VNN72_16715 [Polyangiaceae bacterium]|nr:hypothetical protein [Polyangiaceae bacterium]
MATPFAGQNPTTSDRAERAALLSSEFHGMRKRAPYSSAHVPAGFSGTMPVAPNQIRSILDRAFKQKSSSAGPPSTAERARQAEVESAAAHSLRHSAKHAGVIADLLENSSRLAPPSTRKVPLIHDAYTDIDFNDEFVTKITVNSWIQNVTATEADACVEMSYPPNWSKAIKTFYQQSQPVSWSQKAGGYVANDSVAKRDGQYDLLEYVTWDWSLQNDGGIANILRITESTPDGKGVEKLVKKIRDAADEETPGESARVPLPSGGAYANTRAITYRYQLVRCIQAKFASIWESGGLDVDQGSFTVAWVDETKTLYVSGDKALRYSHEADVVPGFANMLNMLAPAVTSMLMKQLAYLAFVTWLEKSRDPGRTS